MQSLMLVFFGTLTQGKNVFIYSCVYEIFKSDLLLESKILLEEVHWKGVLGTVISNSFDAICGIFVQMLEASTTLQIFRSY